MKPYDVYAYGVIAYSTLYVLDGNFPAAEGYGEIKESYTMTGGEATNASIVLAQLGVRVKLDGNWIGNDTQGNWLKQFLDSRGIDSSRLVPKELHRSVQEIVFADKQTRTVFGTYCQLLADTHWNLPKKEDIIRAKVVCLDPFFRTESYLASEIAAKRVIPVVTTDCKHDHPIVKNASAIIVGRPFLQENYGTADIHGVFHLYQANTDGLVIFTLSDKPLLYARNREEINRFQPYTIQPIDTTGGGDSFRAGIVYGILKRWEDEQIIRFASAVAAIVCMRFPGVLNAPTYEEVEAFMKKA